MQGQMHKMHFGYRPNKSVSKRMKIINKNQTIKTRLQQLKDLNPYPILTRSSMRRMVQRALLFPGSED